MTLRPAFSILPAAASLLLPGLVSTFTLPTASGATTVARNVILVLSDDHRYDFMGFHPDAPEWLDTPAMDYMAAQGAHVANAFVTTSLCSPARASFRSRL